MCINKYTSFLYIMQVICIKIHNNTFFPCILCIYAVQYHVKRKSGCNIPLFIIFIFMEDFKMAKEKVILAYSGGLDTTAIIPWLKENYDYDVVCCCVDCGQGNELDGLEERAKYSGAAKLYIEDITDEFCDDYIIPCVQAGAVYENKYLLGTSMEVS